MTRTSVDYSGAPVEIEVMMAYHGDLTLDASASDFEIGAITAYGDDHHTDLKDTGKQAAAMTVRDLAPNLNCLFIIQGAAGVASGTLDVTIERSSDGPTPAPTTKSSTTDSPTTMTSTTTTTSTTTPAPTNSDKMHCGAMKSGANKGASVHIEVELPYGGREPNGGAELTDTDGAGDALTVHDLAADGEYLFVIAGAPNEVRGGGEYTTVRTKVCSQHTDCDMLHKCDVGVARPDEGDLRKKSSDCKKGQSCEAGEKKPEKDPAYVGGCFAVAAYATKGESTKCLAHGNDQPKCERNEGNGCEWDALGADCVEQVTNDNGCCATNGGAAEDFAPTCHDTEDKDRCFAYGAKDCEWRTGEDKKDDKKEDKGKCSEDDESCCAQTNQYATDKEVVVCALQAG